MVVWPKFSLRKKIYFLLCALFFITIAGGLVLVWYTYRVDDRLTGIIDNNIIAYHAAAELESALVNQKGFISYYLLDGDPDWLKMLGTYRQVFKERLETVRSLSQNSRQLNDIETIGNEYARYIEVKDQVIGLYRSGQNRVGAKLHDDSRDLFFKILDLCDSYKNSHMDKIIEVKRLAHAQSLKLRFSAFAIVLLDCIIGIFLALILVKQILEPVHKLTLETKHQESSSGAGDEINALEKSVRGLIDDIDESHSQLAKSRENLLQAEKMAMVGQLAAGMAHGIRNPFTSVKMRLFSLGRSLNLTEDQAEDFDVIDKEIRHIDTIIQNFLEFSRPPRFESQIISPSPVVDMVIQLVKHRLKAHDTTIELIRNHLLPKIGADPERLKEAMVNLIVNACESMGSGGRVVIREEVAVDSTLGNVVVISIADNGPGISDAVQEKIFNPFYTTKAKGTGLGLSIVERIINDHNGRIDVHSDPGVETVFRLILPQKE